VGNEFLDLDVNYSDIRRGKMTKITDLSKSRICEDKNDKFVQFSQINTGSLEDAVHPEITEPEPSDEPDAKPDEILQEETAEAAPEDDVQVENQERDSGYEPSEQELERYATDAEVVLISRYEVILYVQHAEDNSRFNLRGEDEEIKFAIVRGAEPTN
jgi:hypothetical protein